MKAAGAEFMMPPTKVTRSTIATVNDQIDAVTRLDDL
jgi:hypothetical protein